MGTRGTRGQRGAEEDEGAEEAEWVEVAEGDDRTDVAAIYILSYGQNTMGKGYMALWDKMNKMSEGRMDG